MQALFRCVSHPGQSHPPFPPKEIQTKAQTLCTSIMNYLCPNDSLVLHCSPPVPYIDGSTPQMSLKLSVHRNFLRTRHIAPFQKQRHHFLLLSCSPHPTMGGSSSLGSRPWLMEVPDSYLFLNIQGHTWLLAPHLRSDQVLQCLPPPSLLQFFSFLSVSFSFRP